MEASVVVKGPAGQYYSDLVKACEDHFSRIYPDYVNSEDHDTVMCPPVFPFGYVAPTGKASGATSLTDIEKASIDGDTAELKIFHMLEKFGERTNQPMFVLTQVKISEFIKNVLRQKLPADHPILASKLNFEGEIDFLIIHRQIGVILIEVKAAKKFSKSVQGKAQKQLLTGKEIIHALLHADQEETVIPVYKVVAMPNLGDPGRENQNFISLREKNVQSDGDFVRWWESKFAKTTFGRHEKREIQNFIHIFVGQKCEVSSKVLLEVGKKIDKQTFLQKSYERFTKQGVDGAEVVLKTAGQSEQAILAKQFLFLNPEQLRIWNGPRHQFFNGSSGSGKTILLQFRALERAKKGEKVIIVVPSSLITLYKEFFAKNNISSGVDVLSPPGALEFFQRIVPGSDEANFHFFSDELQTFEAEIPDMLMFLENVLARIEGLGYYCWIAYDYMQRNEDGVCRDETGGLSYGLKIQAQARELCKTHNIYHAPCLKTIVRSTFEVYSFVQAFVKKSLLDLVQRLKLSRYDHIDKETKEIWIFFAQNYDDSNHLGHHICGPSVTVFKNSDFHFITQVVENEIESWVESDSLQRVAVLLTTSFPKESLSRPVEKKGIPVRDIDSQKNAVVLDFGRKAHSHEWPVVVAISRSDNDLSANYIMFTRAVSRLVVITSKDVSL